MDLSTRQGRREQGQRIQRAVERVGYSVEELAGKIGCSRALIYQYLSGTTLAQPDRLQQIAAECGLPLTYFYGEQIEPGETPAAHEAPPPGADVAARLRDSLRSLEELADAQEGPPDYRALAVTCERILSLASQMGDRQAQAHAQWRLGNAYLSLADYPRAADALERAIVLARETEDAEHETRARQSLGKALVAMGRTQEAWQQFTQVAAGGDFVGRWQGALSLGCIHELRGEYQQAMQRFDEASAILEEGDARGTAPPDWVAVGLLYVNANRTNVYLDGGDFRGARALAEKCLLEAESLGIADQSLEAHLNLASCDYTTGRWSAAYRNLTTTLQLSRYVGDQGRETVARAWLGLFLAAAGDFDAAAAHGKDALARALSRGDRRSELYAQLALTDAYTGQALRESEARYHMNQALAVAIAQRHDREEIDCRLRQARLGARLGDAAEIREAAARALTLASRLGARHQESQAHLWLGRALLLESAAAPGPQPGLAAARDQAVTALKMARDMDLAEPRWRAHDLMARIALASNPPDNVLAEGELRAAVSVLEGLRAALIEAGIPDALLENEECVAVYARLTQLLQETGRAEEAFSFIEQSGWPPLSLRTSEEGPNTADAP